MNPKQLGFAGLLCLSFISFSASAQIPGLPNASSNQTITQELGLNTVTVSYSRPNVKHRKIFGKLVPFGEVWRTGANTATSISFSGETMLAGNIVPAGDYSLFTIPGKNEWTIIINKATKQWGAYSYDQKLDLLRFTVKSKKLASNEESLLISFNNSTASSVNMQLSWEHTTLSIPLKVDDGARITANIEQLMQAEHNSNLVYFNAIQYYYDHNKDATKALQWIQKAKADVPTNPAFYLFETRFRLRQGDKAGAIAAAEAGISLAKERKFDEYIRLNSEALKLAKQ